MLYFQFFFSIYFFYHKVVLAGAAQQQLAHYKGFEDGPAPQFSIYIVHHSWVHASDFWRRLYTVAKKLLVYCT